MNSEIRKLKKMIFTHLFLHAIPPEYLVNKLNPLRRLIYWLIMSAKTEYLAQLRGQMFNFEDNISAPEKILPTY